jgi:hypothetical protein
MQLSTDSECWNNFVDRLILEYNEGEPLWWRISHTYRAKIINESLKIYDARCLYIEKDDELLRIQKLVVEFENEHKMNLFILKWS